MKLELQGVLAKIGQEHSGNGAKGEWKLRGFTLKITEGKYVNYLPFTAWDDAVDFLNKCNQGDEVKVLFSISHKKNKKEEWETKLNAFNIEVVSEAGINQERPVVNGSNDEDLPF